MKILILLLSLSSSVVYAGAFGKIIKELQVYEDRVRLNVGVTYGTCGSREGWWGWSTGNARHKDWLALALTAQAQRIEVIVYDAQDSCGGPASDITGLEGLFIKTNP